MISADKQQYQHNGAGTVSIIKEGIKTQMLCEALNTQKAIATLLETKNSNGVT